MTAKMTADYTTARRLHCPGNTKYMTAKMTADYTILSH